MSGWLKALGFVTIAKIMLAVVGVILAVKGTWVASALSVLPVFNSFINFVYKQYLVLVIAFLYIILQDRFGNTRITFVILGLIALFLLSIRFGA